MGTTPKTDFLVATPSMVSGSARIVDFGGFFDQYNSGGLPDDADQLAIGSDWEVVGSEIGRAMDLVSEELQTA